MVRCRGRAATRDYLDDVGLFDERLFLYYEDFELAWRGRLRGWSYRYVPTSLVRHRHAATSGLGSSTFVFHTLRNRPLVLARLAPADVAWRGGLGVVRRAVPRPLGRLVGQRGGPSAESARVGRSYLRLLPGFVRDRFRRPRIGGAERVAVYRAWCRPRPGVGG